MNADSTSDLIDEDHGIKTIWSPYLYKDDESSPDWRIVETALTETFSEYFRDLLLTVPSPRSIYSRHIPFYTGNCRLYCVNYDPGALNSRKSFDLVQQYFLVQEKDQSIQYGILLDGREDAIYKFNKELPEYRISEKWAIEYLTFFLVATRVNGRIRFVLGKHSENDKHKGSVTYYNPARRTFLSRLKDHINKLEKTHGTYHADIFGLKNIAANAPTPESAMTPPSARPPSETMASENSYDLLVEPPAKISQNDGPTSALGIRLTYLAGNRVVAQTFSIDHDGRIWAQAEEPISRKLCAPSIVTAKNLLYIRTEPVVRCQKPIIGAHEGSWEACHIEGDLDFSRQQLQNLTLKNLYLTGDMFLDNTHVKGSIHIEDCYIAGNLQMDYIQVDGHISISNSYVFGVPFDKETTRLSEATISMRNIQVHAGISFVDLNLVGPLRGNGMVTKAHCQFLGLRVWPRFKMTETYLYKAIELDDASISGELSILCYEKVWDKPPPPQKNEEPIPTEIYGSLSMQRIQAKSIRVEGLQLKKLSYANTPANLYLSQSTIQSDIYIGSYHEWLSNLKEWAPQITTSIAGGIDLSRSCIDGGVLIKSVKIDDNLLAFLATVKGIFQIDSLFYEPTTIGEDLILSGIRCSSDISLRYVYIKGSIMFITGSSGRLLMECSPIYQKIEREFSSDNASAEPSPKAERSNVDYFFNKIWKGVVVGKTIQIHNVEIRGNALFNGIQVGDSTNVSKLQLYEKDNTTFRMSKSLIRGDLRFFKVLYESELEDEFKKRDKERLISDYEVLSRYGNFPTNTELESNNSISVSDLRKDLKKRMDDIPQTNIYGDLDLRDLDCKGLLDLAKTKVFGKVDMDNSRVGIGIRTCHPDHDATIEKGRFRCFELQMKFIRVDGDVYLDGCDILRPSKTKAQHLPRREYDCLLELNHASIRGPLRLGTNNYELSIGQCETDAVALSQETTESDKKEPKGVIEFSHLRCPVLVLGGMKKNVGSVMLKMDSADCNVIELNFSKDKVPCFRLSVNSLRVGHWRVGGNTGDQEFSKAIESFFKCTDYYSIVKKKYFPRETFVRTISTLRGENHDEEADFLFHLLKEKEIQQMEGDLKRFFKKVWKSIVISGLGFGTHSNLKLIVVVLLLFSLSVLAFSTERNLKSVEDFETRQAGLGDALVLGVQYNIPIIRLEHGNQWILHDSGALNIPYLTFQKTKLVEASAPPIEPSVPLNEMQGNDATASDTSLLADAGRIVVGHFEIPFLTPQRFGVLISLFGWLLWPLFILNFTGIHRRNLE